MIRRTAARAFGPAAVPGSPAAEGEAASARSRTAMVNGFFSELHAGFERAAGEARAANAPAGEAAAAGPLSISKIHTRPEGLEFMVEGPRAAYRFLNSMRGYFWMSHRQGDRSLEESLLSLHPEAGVLTPIERPAAGGRAPFHFTSIPHLIRRCLREAR